MKRVLELFILSLLAGSISSVGIAANNNTGNVKLGEPEKINSGTANDKAQAEVLSVDKIEGKITLKHGPLKKLDMPAMTMDFKVKDLAMVNHIKKGDKVNFVAENIEGELIVTMIEVAK